MSKVTNIIILILNAIYYCLYDFKFVVGHIVLHTPVQNCIH